MNILAIDIGTYSIKFLEIRPERKNYLLVDKTEIVIDEVRPHYQGIDNLRDLQKEIVANYIQKKPNEIKIVFQIPNEFITTRYFEIPGTSKRKAEQIIPFQLDENLPYPITNAHIGSRLQKTGTGFSVISNITQFNVFKDFFSYFETKDAQPTLLTSEVSTIQSYIEHIRLNDTCCILDIGHKSTKAYFIQGRQVVSNHTSFTAGSQINEVIAKTYQISQEDAVLYKHENAFFLTDDLLQDVTPEQREFAILMKQILQPMLHDFKLWEIGHRVKFGTSIDKIYLMGGSSQINGLDNFINFHTGIKTEMLPPIIDFKNDYSPYEKAFYLVKMMAISQKNSSSLINFLTGKFQTASNAFISLHSAVFIWVRTSFIAILLILGLLSERYFFLKKADENYDKKIIGLMKTPSREISQRDQKNYKNKPENILSLIGCIPFLLSLLVDLLGKERGTLLQ